MKTTIHNHLRGQNGCLGFYYGLASLLSAYPEGGLPGEFFINGETQSIWIYNPQNEMFQRFKTKCSFLQNEAYLCKSFFLP